MSTKSLKVPSGLKEGDLLLVGYRKVNKEGSDHLTLDFAEQVKKRSIDSIFHTSDPRWINSNKPRRCFKDITPQDFQRIFGIDPSGATNEWTQLNKLNPTIEGKRYYMQILESTNPSRFQEQNVLMFSKHIPANVEKNQPELYFIKDNKQIFSSTTLSLESGKHILIQEDERVTEEVLIERGIIEYEDVPEDIQAATEIGLTTVS